MYAWWWEGNWRPKDVPYTIHHLGGSETVRVNQRTNGGQWNLLGTFDFEGEGSVVVSDDVSSGEDVVADAVRLVYVGPLPAATPTPTETPAQGDALPGEITLTGAIYDAGTSQGIPRATLSVVACVPRKYATRTGRDGYYDLRLQGSDLRECTQVTLEVRANGYETLSLTVSVDDLYAQSQRDFRLTPLSAERPTREVTTIRDRGDANGDCVINLLDLITVASAYNPSGPISDPAADLNGDGVVNLFDLMTVATNYGLRCP